MKKNIILFIILILCNCSSTQFTLNKTIFDNNALKKIRTIVVFPCQSHEDISDSVRNECELLFITKLTAAGFTVIDQNKVNTALKEKNLTINELTPENLLQIAHNLKADTIFQSEIINNSEENTLVRDYENEPASIKKLLVFQMVIKLISVDTGSIILTIQNDNPQIIRNREDPDGNINARRKEILKEISNDLISTLKM